MVVDIVVGIFVLVLVVVVVAIVSLEERKWQVLDFSQQRTPWWWG
jgi:hypothetical protein